MKKITENKGPETLSFLEAIASAYVDRFNDLSDFCFVFPNKRAGRFFLQAVSNAYGERTALSPRVTSIADFAEDLSGRIVASRVDLIFRLYNVYLKLRGKTASAEPEGILDFDAFRGLGEILLADFNEVDQYYVDPEVIFKNVSDFKQIASNFLSEEQLEILEKYFGITPSQKGIERFWKNLTPPKDLSEIKTRFLNLWQIMLPLYNELNADLEHNGLTSQGGAYRIALENIRNKGHEILKFKKMIFVGFNALSTTEALIFEELVAIDGAKRSDEEESFAHFYWDTPGPILSDPHSDPATFLRLNIRNFPSPKWAKPFLDKCAPDQMPPDIRIIASPSNAVQAKLAANRVEEIFKEYGNQETASANTAVVLPDENLLLPLLYGLPEEMSDVNLTMGYSLRLTSAATFLHHLRRLVGRARTSGNNVSFATQDLREFLAHPFAHSLFGTRKISKLNTFLSERRRVYTPIAEVIQYLGQEATALNFTLYPPSTQGSINFVEDILLRADAAIEKSQGIVKGEIDRSHIQTFRDGLRRLLIAVEEHKIPLDIRGVMYMTDKILASEHVAFEGKPLKGLQVMGLLETRALDFDHLVIPSLNDSIMPRKARRATFIPDTLRYGYGMPFSNYQERLFSYYFYRMIARAKSVTLIYDARAGEGMRSGGISRYLLQLKYIHDPEKKIKYEGFRFALNANAKVPQPVEKTSDVMRRLQLYTDPKSNKRFSASSLKKYFECPARFYYETIMGIKTDEEDSEYISSITQGNIVHEVMLNLYFPEPDRGRFLKNRIRLTAQHIDSILSNRNLIRREVNRSINRLHFNLKEEELDSEISGTARMIAEMLEQQIIQILRYDRSIAPLDLVGGEARHNVRWQFAPGRSVNMVFAIDRIDILKPDALEPQWRIIDYKTGKSGVEAKEFNDIFSFNSKAKYIFQLMLYSNLLNAQQNMSQKFRPSIYAVNTLNSSGETRVKVEKNIINSHEDINESFIKELNKAFIEIFDPTIPFKVAKDPEACTYCKLHELCHR